MDLECDAYKQMEVILSDSLLPQEYAKYIENYIMVNLCYIANNTVNYHVTVNSNHSV